MKKIWLTLAIVLFFSIPLVSWAGIEVAKNQKESLRGLKNITVIVSLAGSFREEELTKEQVQRDVQLKFRLAGITVPTKPKLPGVFVLVSIMKPQHLRGCFYVTDMVLYQKVILAGKEITVITWGHRFYGTMLLVSELRYKVQDQVDIFINDYLAVNPK